MSMDLQRFHATFFEESREGLDAMEAGLLAPESGQQDAEIINSVFRAAHSIKGGAGTFGFDAIAGLTHVLETLLDELRAGKRALEGHAVDAMLSSVDVLRARCAKPNTASCRPRRCRRSEGAPRSRSSGQAASSAPVAAAAKVDDTPEARQIGFTPAPSLFMSGNDPLRIIRELEHLGSLQVAARMERLPGFAQLDPLEAHLAWDLGLVGKVPRSKIEDTFARVLDDCELDIRPAAPPSPPPRPRPQRPPLRWQRRRRHLPRLPPAVVPARSGNLDPRQRRQGRCADQPGRRTGHHPCHAQAGLARAGPGPRREPVRRPDQLERNTRDLQEAVIGVRMLPVDAVFRRFPRLVRDLSSRLGKQVRLRTVGEGTELDKGLIEKIADPLVHLVRNSIDHGPEMPDVRRGAGKDETGTITLAASHQGGHIVIEVSDDGRGPTAPRSPPRLTNAAWPCRTTRPIRRSGT